MSSDARRLVPLARLFRPVMLGEAESLNAFRRKRYKTTTKPASTIWCILYVLYVLYVYVSVVEGLTRRMKAKGGNLCQLSTVDTFVCAYIRGPSSEATSSTCHFWHRGPAFRSQRRCHPSDLDHERAQRGKQVRSSLVERRRGLPRGLPTHHEPKGTNRTATVAIAAAMKTVPVGASTSPTSPRTRKTSTGTQRDGARASLGRVEIVRFCGLVITPDGNGRDVKLCVAIIVGCQRLVGYIDWFRTGADIVSFGIPKSPVGHPH